MVRGRGLIHQDRITKDNTDSPIADNLNDKANELYASAEKDSKLITTGISDSVKRGEQLMQVAMGAAQSAVAKDEMVKSVVQAYLTGGMAGIQQMVKDKIRDAFIDKVAEATGINPDLVRFATGRFEQAKLTKKMNNQASKIGTGVGVMASLALGPVGPLMMAGPMGGALLGAGAGGKLGSSLSGGTLRTTLNNPIVDAGLTMSSGLAGAMMGGPAGLVAGVAAKNKLMQSSSVVSNNNQYNALQQQENALIQDAAGAAVANAIGRPDAAGNFSQILGGLKKRQVAKKNNANLGKVASTGIAAGMNMATGMVKGIVKNAIIAVGGSADTFDHLTANPFTPPATWTGAAKVDMSKEGWKDRIQEYATAEFLEANGMDADLAKTVASTTNAKIKAKKAKKEEKTKAIESTAQTVLAVAAMVVTAGAAAPALGSVLTGSAGASFYAVQGANIALQAAIGSRTGGVQGAVAGVVNGTLQSLAATNLGALTKGSKELVGKAKEVQQMALDNPILIKALAATNVSYTKEDGWGIKANVTGVVNALGADKSLLNKIANSFNSVTIGQSQRGGATVNLGISTGSGTLGLNYTGNSGKWDGSFDVIERQAGTGNLSAELNYGEDGFSVSGNADLGNGLGFGLESGRNGTTGSLTILGSQQGTVDEDGNYEANSNFLGEISGQDIIDLNEARQAQRDAAENERNPAKSAKDAKDAKNTKDAADAKEARDDDAKEVGGKEGPEGIVDLVFAGTAVLVSAAATFIAGGGSSSASPSAPSSGQGAAGNGGNATIARKPEDDDNAVGHDNENPSKGLTSKELNDYKALQDKLRANEDLTPAEQERHAYLGKIRNIEVNANSVADANNGGKVRDVDAEIRQLRDGDQAEMKRLQDKVRNNTATNEDKMKLGKLFEKLSTIEVHGQRDPKDFSFLDGIDNPIEAVALIREKYGNDVADAYAQGVDNQKMRNFWKGLADSTILSPLTAYDWMQHSPKDANPKPVEPEYTMPDEMKGKTEAEKEAYIKGKKLEDKNGMSNTIGTGLGVGVMVAGGILLSTWVGGAMGVSGILGGIKSKLSNLTKIERTVVKETGKKKNILNAADDALPDPNKARINPNSVDELPPNGKKPLSTENLSDTENPNLHPDGTRPLDIDPENNRINPSDPNDSRLADLKRKQAEQNTLRDEQKRKQDELAKNGDKGKQPQEVQQQQGFGSPNQNLFTTFRKLPLEGSENLKQSLGKFGNIDLGKLEIAGKGKGVYKEVFEFKGSKELDGQVLAVGYKVKENLDSYNDIKRITTENPNLKIRTVQIKAIDGQIEHPITQRLTTGYFMEKVPTALESRSRDFEKTLTGLKGLARDQAITDLQQLKKFAEQYHINDFQGLLDKTSGKFYLTDSMGIGKTNNPKNDNVKNINFWLQKLGVTQK